MRKEAFVVGATWPRESQRLAYRDAMGFLPPHVRDHAPELIDQFTYKGRNTRGRRILATARVVA